MIADGEDGLESDFITTSGGAADEGKVPKLNASGKLDNTFPSRFGCKVYQNSGSNISGSAEVVAFQVEEFDDDTMHDNVTNNSRITINTAGTYLVGATVTVLADSKAMIARIRLNGSTYITGGGNPSTNGPSMASCSVVRAFSVNDYIEVIATAGSGSTSSGAESTNFWAILLQSS
jgi:hypothetical protein